MIPVCVASKRKRGSPSIVLNILYILCRPKLYPADLLQKAPKKQLIERQGATRDNGATPKKAGRRCWASGEKEGNAAAGLDRTGRFEVSVHECW